ncbi:HlyD family efflux transporter periplasmic adaptor subunit [Paucibacter sp. TC2R-5]|uniref:HlyD family secretion protein n=1 Tax=Paucibacter sp. TC2R-5 TaxID=2893555 RepID=UPI0021E4E04B|nr:HlyD family efflux transporter periplasmic adaptor subunit [Paucibacter sp. TC2R-5]MCV2358506.1 HlyD family efflux transporter periplasmic adaptor subunit [Paucibacter sp. TC2R-5]
MLFRPEAHQGQQQAWLGSIQLLRPLSLRVLSLTAVTAVVVVAVFLSQAEYTRKARVSGYLLPDRGVLRVSSAQAATVLTREVSEGQSVKAGDVLFVLSLDSANQSAEAIAKNLSAGQQSLQMSAEHQRQLAHTQQQTLTLRSKGIERELSLLKAEAGLQQERQALADAALARLEQLSREQFISAAQVQAKREEVLGLRAQGQALERQRETLLREQAATLAEAQQLPLKEQVLQGVIERDSAELNRLGLETEGKRRLVLRAPSDGVVATLQAEPGQSVNAGAVLASVLPAQAQMLAQLYAPSSAVGFVRPQQAVNLRYQAFPYQKFGSQSGRVLQVSRTPLTPAELALLNLPAALSQGAQSEPLYRITVGLDRQTVTAYGQEQALSAGMQLEADVLLERRRLIEWIFEPLLSLARRV